MAVRGGRMRGVNGMNGLRRLLARLDRESTEELKIHVSQFAKSVEATAAARAAGGRMASHRYSIGITSAVSRAGFSATVGLRTKTAQKRAWFAHFIEFGTKAGLRVWKGKAKRAMRRRTGSMEHPGTPAAPVLLPAFEQHYPQFEPRITAAIRAILEKAAIGARQAE